MTLVFIELNELNFDYIKLYFKKNNFKNFKFIYKNIIKTNSEKEYSLLEPWIQWHTIHTGLRAKEHKVFRLGDSIYCKKKQIFEELENFGLKVGSLSSMNVVNKLKKPSYFIPDPWTNTLSDNNFFSKIFTNVLKDAVNNNASGKIKIINYFFLILIFFRYVRLPRYFYFCKLFSKSFHKKWYKSIFLDALIHEVHIFLLNKKVDFSSVFFNAGAHIQHHYLLNSLANKNLEKNPSNLINKKEDPFFDVLMFYETILSDYFKNENIKILLATGLTQQIVNKPFYYYRLLNHSSFLKKIKVEFQKVETRMSRDFLIFFENKKQLESAFKILDNIFLNNKKLFGVLEKRNKSIFVTLTYDQEILANDYILYKNFKIKMSSETVFVALKNGHHSPRGFLFIDKKIKEKIKLKIKSIINIKDIKKIIKKYFYLNNNAKKLS